MIIQQYISLIYTFITKYISLHLFVIFTVVSTSSVQPSTGKMILNIKLVYGCDCYLTIRQLGFHPRRLSAHRQPASEARVFIPSQATRRYKDPGLRG